MFLALNSIRPTGFSILHEDDVYVFQAIVPLSLQQVVDTISIEGVSVDLVRSPFVESDNGTVTKSDGITIEALPNNTSCILSITSPRPPFVSMLGNLSVVW